MDNDYRIHLSDELPPEEVLSLLGEGHDHLSCKGRISEGWSNDEKFLLIDSSCRKFILRLSGRVPIANRLLMADATMMARRAGMNAPTVVRTGTASNGAIFALLSWIEGKPLACMLPALQPERQYSIGYDSGRLLRSFHEQTLSYGDAGLHCSIEMLKKLSRHLIAYKEAGLRLPFEKYALSGIKSCLGSLEGRPACLQHGDFHTGNMVIDDSGNLGFIDFDRCSWGDPYEEFYKAQFFSRTVSIEFTNGQIHGYFAGDPPAVFWKALRLYVSHAALHSSVWAMQFGKSEMENMRSLGLMSANDFGSFKLENPSGTEASQNEDLSCRQ